MKAMFEKIAAASATNRSANFVLGTKGTLIIQRAIEKETYKDGNAAIFEFRYKTIEATMENVALPKVGSLVGKVFLIEKHEAAPGACKALILSVLGANESDTNPEDFKQAVEAIFGKEQPFAGMDVAFETYPWTTKAGKQITLERYTHVPQTPEQIAEQKAAIIGAEKAEEKKAA